MWLWGVQQNVASMEALKGACPCINCAQLLGLLAGALGFTTFWLIFYFISMHICCSCSRCCCCSCFVCVYMCVFFVFCVCAMQHLWHQQFTVRASGAFAAPHALPVWPCLVTKVLLWRKLILYKLHLPCKKNPEKLRNWAGSASSLHAGSAAAEGQAEKWPKSRANWRWTCRKQAKAATESKTQAYPDWISCCCSCSYACSPKHGPKPPPNQMAVVMSGACPCCN